MEREDTFYSKGVVFWIAGYVHDSNGGALGFARAITKYTTEFAARVGVDPEKVKTFVVDNSRSHKYERVFWADVAECPAGVASLQNMSMSEFLQ